MPYFTIVHFIFLVIFILVFAMLVILSQKEKNPKTRLSLIIVSFVIVLMGFVVSVLILDKYTKKGKLLKYTTKRDYNHEAVIIRGAIKNQGKFKIAYCTLDIKIVNKVIRKKGSVFKYKTSSVGDMFKSKGYKKNFLQTSVTAVKNLKPKLTKSFNVSVKIPSSFQNPRYFMHLVCH